VAGAKTKMLEYLLQHIGEEVDRGTLSQVAQIVNWPRSLRLLRQEGYDLEATRNGYILHSDVRNELGNTRENISQRLRYKILMRDNGICQRCGAVASDGVKMHVDHKIPVDMGGDNSEENLWTLCEICNEGKKAFFQDINTEMIADLLRIPSTRRRLIKLFSDNPNVEMDVTFLEIICAGTRDWTRVIRNIRSSENMDIRYIRRNNSYIYYD